jgi:prepilin-type N-terminal cleavage/methylation domain-containing protein
MKSPRHTHNQQGFTMIEMLIAMLVMTIGVLATVSTITTSMTANTHSNRLTTKTALAQQITEDLLSCDKSTLVVPVTNTYKLDITGNANDLNVNGAGTYHAIYSTVWAATNLAQINVVVTTVPDDGLPLKTSIYRNME